MNIPQLRFDGFDGDFKRLQLNDLCQVVDCQHSTAPVQSEPSNFKMIRTSNVRNGRLITETMDSVSEVTYHTWSIRGYLNKDDVILTREAPMGEVAIVQKEDVKYFLGQRVLQLKSNKSNIIPYYLYLILQSKTFEKYIQPIKAGGSTVSNIRIPELKSMEFQIPTIEEQSKVASLLKLINIRLEKQQEKIEKLEQFKKGMMQKIFSQELRFKDEDGREFGEWEEKELKDIANIVGGGTPPTSTETYWNGSIPWFTPTEISQTKYVNQSKRTITEEGLKKSSAKLLPAGTILLTTRATLGDMAIATVPVTTNQGFQSIVPKEYSVGEFIYYLQPQIKKHCLVNASGSTFMEISKSNLEIFATLIPSKKEQIKISSYLSILDLKIEKEKEKLKVLEEQKRGFMQGMFV